MDVVAEYAGELGIDAAQANCTTVALAT